MNSTKKNGLITFGIIVMVLNVALLLFFAIKYQEIQSRLPSTTLTPTIPTSNPVSGTI